MSLGRSGDTIAVTYYDLIRRSLLMEAAKARLTGNLVKEVMGRVEYGAKRTVSPDRKVSGG